MVSTPGHQRQPNSTPSKTTFPTPPVFPLTPSHLSRFVRFAQKGGIGTCKAVCDCEAKDDKGLMYLEGDIITVLIDLGNGEYLVRCSSVLAQFCISKRNVKLTCNFSFHQTNLQNSHAPDLPSFQFTPHDYLQISSGLFK